ncbi:hypothetical protein ACLK19_00260 [Escherichia coli]
MARLWCRLTPACYARKARPILQNSEACLLVVTVRNYYPIYQQIQQEDATQLRHICLTDVALPADDGVSSFTQLKNQQPATLCYAPPLSTDDTAEISSPPAPPPDRKVW